MTVLVDNDAALKVCRYDLQDLAAHHFGGYNNLRVLESARYSLYVENRTRGLKFTGSQPALERLKAFLAAVPPLAISPDNPYLPALNAIPQVHAGEVALLAAAAEDIGTIVFTGDKRAIRALAAAGEAVDARHRLEGRLKCLEQVVAELIEAFGFRAVGPRIHADPTADTALRVCFALCSEQNAIEGLRSYYRDLNRAAPGLLAPPPAIIT